MQLQELPLEIQNAIFETLIVCHNPKTFIRARLASSYFARSIRGAFIRSEACFKVYLGQPPPNRDTWASRRYASNVDVELEVAYLTARFSSNREILKGSETESFPKLERLRALIQDAIAWGDVSDEASRLRTIEQLVRRALAMNYRSLRAIIDPSHGCAGFTAMSFERLSAAAFLGHLHVVLELLDDGVEAVLSWDGFNRWQSHYNHHYTPPAYPYSANGCFSHAFHVLAGTFGNPAVSAAAAGHLEILQAILKPYCNSSKPVLVPEWASALILYAALQNGHNHCVDYMLGDEVHVSFEESIHFERILCAGVDGENEAGIVKLLQATHEDFAPWPPSETTTAPWCRLMNSILEHACRTNKKEFVIFALEHGVGDPIGYPDCVTVAANAAAGSGSIEALEVLLERGNTSELRAVTPYSRRWYGNHPMRSAIKGGHIAAVKLLLDHGISPDISIGGTWGDVPLTEAIREGNAGLVELLLERGASMSLAGTTKFLKPADWKKPSVWHQAHLMSLAAKYGHTEIIRILAKHGVSPDYPYTKPTELQVMTHDPMWHALAIPDSAEELRAPTVRTLVELGAKDPGEMTSLEYKQKAVEPKNLALKRKQEDKEASMTRRRAKGLRIR